MTKIMMVLKGIFYEFHKERVISRPGAPLSTRAGLEIGPEISREMALVRVRFGKDVYTLVREDAYKLAVQVGLGRPPPDELHEPRKPTQSKREDVFYRHFHPGGLHPSEPGGPGHVFYGERGEGFERM